jgi:hypothetical protein
MIQLWDRIVATEDGDHLTTLEIGKVSRDFGSVTNCRESVVQV